MVEDAVHRAGVLGIEQIVSVENEKAVVGVSGQFAVDVAKKFIQGITFADQRGIEALIHFGAAAAGDLSSAVGAVVCDHVNIDQFFRIILRLDALDQFSDDVALIAGRGDEGIAMQLDLRVSKRQRLFAAPEHVRHIIELIGIAEREQDEDR